MCRPVGHTRCFYVLRLLPLRALCAARKVCCCACCSCAAACSVCLSAPADRIVTMPCCRHSVEFQGPRFWNVEPNTGGRWGGTRITIFGSGFTNASSTGLANQVRRPSPRARRSQFSRGVPARFCPGLDWHVSLRAHPAPQHDEPNRLQDHGVRRPVPRHVVRNSRRGRRQQAGAVYGRAPELLLLPVSIKYVLWVHHRTAGQQ